MIGYAPFPQQVRPAARPGWAPHLGQAVTPLVSPVPATAPTTWSEFFVRRMKIAGISGGVGLVIAPLHYLLYPKQRLTRKEGVYSMIFGAGLALIVASIPVSGVVLDYMSGFGGGFFGLGVMDQILPKKKATRTARG